MKTSIRRLALGASFFCLCGVTQAWAGETILYEAAPDWVEPAEIDDDQAAAQTNLRILDRQIRIDDGQVWEYSDTAYRIASHVELTQAGTISADWSPDKGDLIVHEVAIVRDGERIDVLASGAAFEILRRETALEQRIIDGMLTATMAVPGLRVGDTLRLRISVTRAEQALENEVQSLTALIREPGVRAEFARVRASWGDDEGVRFAAGPAVDLPAPTRGDGYTWLELDLPLTKADEVPQDAPMSYRRPALLQLGTFEDWGEVSQVMAPHYEVAGTITRGSDLAGRIAQIRQAYDDPVARMVAALQLVQADIGYLANGLNGGNYLPQSPAETWSLRYGDCKAKTLLLLALLDGLDIEAEGFLVSTGLGDGVADMLPMPAVFDHIIVRAMVAGQEYFLDGTGAGAERAIIGNVPGFRVGLPVRGEGASLQPISQTLPRVSETNSNFTIDQSAGMDLPALLDVRFEMRGALARLVESLMPNLNPEQRIELANSMIYPLLSETQIHGAEITRGPERGMMVVTAQAIMTTPTRFEGQKVSQSFKLPIEQFTFKPDRARSQWRDIPVDIGPPNAATVRYTVILPEGGRGFSLEGARAIDTTIAGHHMVRSAALDANRLTIEEQVSSAGGTLADEEVRMARREAARLGAGALRLNAPADTIRRWRFAGSPDRSALAPLEAAYAARIEQDPGAVDQIVNRARFRMDTYDFTGALADFDRALELERSADLLVARSQAWAELRNRARSRDDLAEAYDLDPDPWRALPLADAMAETGDPDGAVDLLLQIDGDEELRQAVKNTLADAHALAGDVQGGLAYIDEVLSTAPNDPQSLNSKCWFMGRYGLDLDDALPICTRAVESADAPAAALDSRALVLLRLGQLDEALADAEAALDLQPDLVPTELVRGLILREMGNREAEAIIRGALARSPAITPVYQRMGFDLDE